MERLSTRCYSEKIDNELDVYVSYRGTRMETSFLIMLVLVLIAGLLLVENAKYSNEYLL